MVAQTLQLSLLPEQLPEISGYELASLYVPAVKSSAVGGDFYDVFKAARDEWAVVLGDVCGKGADAAACTSTGRRQEITP